MTGASRTALRASASLRSWTVITAGSFLLLQQLRELHAEGLRETLEDLQGGVPSLAALDHRDVALGDPGLGRQLYLRQAPFLPKISDHSAQPLGRQYNSPLYSVKSDPTIRCSARLARSADQLGHQKGHHRRLPGHILITLASIRPPRRWRLVCPLRL